MKNSLTIAYCSARDNPEVDWFIYSLIRHFKGDENVELLIIKGNNSINYGSGVFNQNGGTLIFKEFSPKPTVWSGPSRITKEDWWSKANSLNTSMCLAKGEYFCTMDDRSVLQDGWIDAIRRQMESPFPYVLCGRYEKRHSMTVENGVIKNAGIITGIDNRFTYCQEHYEPNGMKPPYKAPSGWTYGVTTCAPLEWWLNINGVSEECDGLGAEDYTCGCCFANNGYPIFYEPRMLVVEDRTVGMTGPIALRSDYGETPNDYSHWMLERVKDQKRALHPFDIRKLRDSIQRGEPWPKPWGPFVHPYTKTPLSELKPK